MSSRSLDFAHLGNRLIANLTRTRRLQLMKKASHRFLTMQDVLTLLDADLGSLQESQLTHPRKPFTIVTAWPESVLKGSLFVHLSGESESDCKEAMDNGAAMILSEQKVQDYPCLIVSNAAEAYVRICAYLRRQTPVPAVAVTGSVGKTTTKEMLGSVYRQHHDKVFVSPGNSNLLHTVGHYTQLVPAGCGRYVQECHEGDIGSASALSRMIEPSIAIITNIGASHAARFKRKTDLVAEVASITDGMGAGGVVVFNLDCQSSRQADFKRRAITVGVRNTNADYVAEEVRSGAAGVSFTVRSPEGRMAVAMQIPGEHNVENALLVWAAARHDGVPVEAIRRGLEKYRPQGNRQNVVRAGRGRLLHIDCYNAAPQSMRSALARLVSVPVVRAGGRRVAVLGDMEELGPNSTAYHRDVGRLVSEMPIDVLITCGVKAAGIADAARNGCPKVAHAGDLRELVSTVRREVMPGDAVLIKASHSMQFDRVLQGAFPLVYLRHILGDRVRGMQRRLVIGARS